MADALKCGYRDQFSKNPGTGSASRFIRASPIVSGTDQGLKHVKNELTIQIQIVCLKVLTDDC